MNSKAAAGIAILVVIMMGAIAIGTDWQELGFNTDDVPEEKVPFIPGDDDTTTHYRAVSLNGVLFEKYGAIMLVIGALMFGAMIAGVYISREEDDSDD